MPWALLRHWRVSRRFAPLSQRQVEVLRWVADGCPDGIWQDFRYKQTACALADRGLVTVSRRRHSWQAAITIGGRFYLEQGAYQPAKAPGSRPTRSRPPQPAAAALSPARTPPVTAESMLAELQSADGVLTVPDPPGTVRAAYRRAINNAITGGFVPGGFGLRHTGRNRGDLVVRLARLGKEPAWPEPLPAILVPATLQGCHEAVAALRDTPGLLDVSSEVRHRALLIVQAIADECARRGYGFGLRGDGEPTFQIAVGEDCFCFTLSEELERRDVVDAGKLAGARYSWQRIPSSMQQVRSGRLVLRLGSGHGSVSWADRRRSILAQKLPEVFQEVAGRASAQAEERRRKQEERRQRRQAWEEAIPQARQAYIDQLNRDRLREQAARSAEAAGIRGYCARLDSLAKECRDFECADQIRAWAAWARQEADRIDPVRHPERLTYVVPAELRPPDFEKFMPRGLSAWHPPD